jgi:hypothetical protein
MSQFGLWLDFSTEAVTLLAAAAILIRHRRRSRRATGLALAAVACLAGNWLLSLGLVATWGWWKSSLHNNSFVVATEVLVLARHFWRLGCVLLFVWATVADRRAIPLTGSEADYGDDADTRRPPG